MSCITPVLAATLAGMAASSGAGFGSAISSRTLDKKTSLLVRNVVTPLFAFTFAAIFSKAALKLTHGGSLSTLLKSPSLRNHFLLGVVTECAVSSISSSGLCFKASTDKKTSFKGDAKILLIGAPIVIVLVRLGITPPQQ